MSILKYQIDEISAPKNVYDKLSQAYAELEALINSVPGGVAKALIDNESIIIKYASDGFFALCGFSREEYKNILDNDKEAAIIEDIQRLFEKIKKQIIIDELTYTEYKIHKKDGSSAWIMVQGKVISVENGVYTTMCIFTDITGIKEAQRKLEIEEERYRIVADISDDYLFEYDNETDTMNYSEKYKLHFGTDSVVNSYKDSMAKRNIFCEEDGDIFLNFYNNLREGKSLYNAKYRIKEITGEIKWYSICFTTIFNDNNVPIKSIGKVTNIDEQKKETEKLREKARRDSLTKLSNKMTTQKLIERYIEEDGDSFHALMMIDIDDFKSINDTYGHMTGDYVLSEFSSKLKKVFRSTDVVGRVGGDEFLIMLRGIQSDSLIDEKAKSICSIFHSIKIGSNNNVSISGSVGISTYPADGKTYDELLKKADDAVYLAKKSGKDRYNRICEN